MLRQLNYIIKIFLRSIILFFSKLYYSINIVKKDGFYIPASGKVIDKSDFLSTINSSLDFDLTINIKNNSFEKELSKFLNVKYCVTTNSGSSANLLAISLLKSKELGNKKLIDGDEIITLAAGFPTTIFPIIQNNLIPVFVDITLPTYNIHVTRLEESINNKTRAIFLPHTLGNPFNVEYIKKICDKYNLWLIEDNCDSLGSKYKNQYTGSFGDLSTCSFYPAHHITTGEGGAILTNDYNIYKLLLSFRDWGRDCHCSPGKDNTCKKRFDYKFKNLPEGYDHKYIFSNIGYNLKMTDYQASLGLSQIKRIDLFIKKRQKNYNLLFNGLKKYYEYLILPEPENFSEPSWFGFIITIKKNNKFTRLDIIKFLERNAIGTRLLFAGNILRQPVFCNNDFKIKINDSNILISSELTEKDFNKLPVSEIIMNNSFWIGLWHGLNDDDINYTLNIFDKFFEIL